MGPGLQPWLTGQPWTRSLASRSLSFPTAIEVSGETQVSLIREVIIRGAGSPGRWDFSPPPRCIVAVVIGGYKKRVWADEHTGSLPAREY